ncbi:MAG: hypothetical protein ACOZIN_06185 [Myxococcota bacterium]
MKTEKLPADTSRIFATLQKFRESADYDAAFILDPAGAEAAMSDARQFVDRARAFLKSAGLIL